MVTDDEIADATDGDAECEADRGRVHDLKEAVPESPHDRVGRDDRPDDAADQADATAPHGQHVHETLELADVAEDVEEAGADDRPDQCPYHDGAEVLLGHAPAAPDPEHPPRAEEIPDRDPDAMGGDRQRTEADSIEDGPSDCGEDVHGGESSEPLGVIWSATTRPRPLDRGAILRPRPRDSARPGRPGSRRRRRPRRRAPAGPLLS